MHYINGLFLPNRPDVERASGLFPIATEAEITEAISASVAAIDQGHSFRSWILRRRALNEFLMLLYSNYDVIIDTITSEANVFGSDHVDYVFNKLLTKIGQNLVDENNSPNFFVSTSLLVTGWDFDIDFGIWYLYWHLLIGSPVIWIPNSSSCASSQLIIDLINQTGFRDLPGSISLLHGNKNTVKKVLQSDQVSHFVCGVKNIFSTENTEFV